MNNLRSEFEKLPEVKKLIDEGKAFYCDKGDWYLCKDIDNREIELALDSAWYAFQEQQKKIDELKKSITDSMNKNGYWSGINDYVVNCDDIEELLK